MSIYFDDRELTDPIYKNPDYLSQQAQFIHILKMKAKHFSIKCGEIKQRKCSEISGEQAFLHIDLNNVQRVNVCFPSLGLNISIHELFRIWSENQQSAEHQLPHGTIATNLEDFLGTCHDILTVKFQDEWKRVS